MLASLRRVTGDAWEVRHAALENWIGDGRRRVAGGDNSGGLAVLYGATMMEGKGGEIPRTRELADGVLGLRGEDLDVVTRSVVERVSEAHG